MLCLKLRRSCCVSSMRPPADKLLLPCLGAVKIRRALSAFIEAVLRKSVCHRRVWKRRSGATDIILFFCWRGLSLCQISESLVSITTTKTHVHFFLLQVPKPVDFSSQPWYVHTHPACFWALSIWELHLRQPECIRSQFTALLTSVLSAAGLQVPWRDCRQRRSS